MVPIVQHFCELKRRRAGHNCAMATGHNSYCLQIWYGLDEYWTLDPHNDTHVPCTQTVNHLTDWAISLATKIKVGMTDWLGWRPSDLLWLRHGSSMDLEITLMIFIRCLCELKTPDNCVLATRHNSKCLELWLGADMYWTLDHSHDGIHDDLMHRWSTTLRTELLDIWPKSKYICVVIHAMCKSPSKKISAAVKSPRLFFKSTWWVYTPFIFVLRIIFEANYLQKLSLIVKLMSLFFLSLTINTSRGQVYFRYHWDKHWTVLVGLCFKCKDGIWYHLLKC